MNINDWKFIIRRDGKLFFSWNLGWWAAGLLAMVPNGARGQTGFTDANWADLGRLTTGGGFINALVVDTNGNVYVGGNFTVDGVSGGHNIAQWNGSAWSALGSGVNSNANALEVDGLGNFYACGLFTNAGGVAANGVARWNGSAWSALGSGLGGSGENATVSTVACDQSGNLYVGGNFTNAGGVAANSIAEWNGSVWSPLGSGVDGGVDCLAFDRFGNLYAGGYFLAAGGVAASSIAKWDGKAWTALGTGITGGNVYGPQVNALAFDPAGNLYVGGAFYSAGAVSANSIAKWDGSVWSALGAGVVIDPSFPVFVYALACDSSGNVYAGGSFTNAGGVNAHGIARWNTNGWAALGSGVGGSFPYVYSLAFDRFGNLNVGGDFTTAGTNVSYYSAKALLTGPTPDELSLTQAGPATNVITFLGIPGTDYALDLATNLTPPVNWMAQGTNRASTNNATTAGYLIFTNVSGTGQGFYRTRLVAD